MKLSRRKLITYAGSSGMLLAGAPWARKEQEAAASTLPPLLLSIRIEGGWDPTMVFDSKIDVDTVAGESGCSSSKLSTAFSHVANSNRPAVSSFFSSHWQKSVIVNGISCGGIEHQSAFDQNFSVELPSAHNRGSGRRSDPAQIYALATNPGLSVPHVNIGCRSTSGAYSPFSHQLTSSLMSRYATGNFRKHSSFSESTDTAVRQYLNSRFAQSLSLFPSIGIDSEKIDGLARNYSREHYLYESMPGIMNSVGSPATALLRNTLVALELMASGQTLSASIGDENFFGWDTHKNHFGAQAIRFESLFSDLSTVLSYASNLGISDRLILVVGSDVGRSPTLNEDAGKNHWPYTSALVHSPLISGGQVIGSTDEHLRGTKVDVDTGLPDATNGRLVTMSQIFAAIFAITELNVEDTFGSEPALNTLVAT